MEGTSDILAPAAKGPACERCGRCLTVCPVYQETRVETLSPRGRLDLIRAVAEGGLIPGDRYHEAIHSCLQCLACHDACPKGVDGALAIRQEKAALIHHQGGWRAGLEAGGLKLMLGHRPLLSRGTALLQALVRPGQRSRRAATRHLPLFLPELLAGKRLPELYLANRADTLPSLIDPPVTIPVRDEVILFTGCFFGFLDTRPLTAAVRVLQENGIRIRLPRSQVCCGAPAVLSGHPDIMEDSAKINLAALDGGLPVVTLCATCGNALKSEYPQRFQTHPLLGPRAANLSRRVTDLSTYLAGMDDFRTGAFPVNMKVTVHTPCHLNRGMKEGSGTAAFLSLLPGLDIIPLEGDTECCGGGGICALKNPGLSRQLGDKKSVQIVESGAEVVAAPCPGCLLQIRDRLSALGQDPGLCARHPVELAAQTFGHRDQH